MNPLAMSQGNPGFIPEIEQSLLGALLAGGDHGKALAILDPESFVEPLHQEMFRLIVAARDGYGATTLPVVAKLAGPELQKSFQQETGTTLAAYMAGCLANTGHSPATSGSAARGVLEQWARISAGREAARLTDAARDPSARPQELLRSAAQAMDDIGSRLRSGARSKTQFGFGEAA